MQNNENKGQDIFDLLGKITAENPQKEELINQYYAEIERLLPNHLYKYYSYSQYAVESMSNEQACFNNPSFFNDPFDSGANLSHEGAKNRKKNIDDISLKLKILENNNSNIESINKKLEEKEFFTCNDYEQKKNILRDVFNGIKEDKKLMNNNLILNDVKTISETIYFNTGDKGTNPQLGDVDYNVRIFCMSESKNNTLMWAHYGKNDTGICLEYSKNDILNYMNKNKNNFLFLIPVYYTNEKLLQNLQYSSENQYSLLRYFMLKKRDWSYESEWRFVKYYPNLKYLNFEDTNLFCSDIIPALSMPVQISDHDVLPFIKPKSIILGAKFDFSNLDLQNDNHSNKEKNESYLKEKYESCFIEYLSKNQTKIKFLSFCDQLLGYYENEFMQ